MKTFLSLAVVLCGGAVALAFDKTDADLARADAVDKYNAASGNPGADQNEWSGAWQTRRTLIQYFNNTSWRWTAGDIAVFNNLITQSLNDANTAQDDIDLENELLGVDGYQYWLGAGDIAYNQQGWDAAVGYYRKAIGAVDTSVAWHHTFQDTDFAAFDADVTAMDALCVKYGY